MSSAPLKPQPLKPEFLNSNDFAGYVEMVDNQLDKLPIQDTSDIEKIRTVLLKILSHSIIDDEVSAIPLEKKELKTRFSLIQSYLEEPGEYIDVEHKSSDEVGEYFKIITTKISQKIQELESFTSNTQLLEQYKQDQTVAREKKGPIPTPHTVEARTTIIPEDHWQQEEQIRLELEEYEAVEHLIENLSEVRALVYDVGFQLNYIAGLHDDSFGALVEHPDLARRFLAQAYISHDEWLDVMDFESAHVDQLFGLMENFNPNETFAADSKGNPIPAEIKSDLESKRFAVQLLTQGTKITLDKLVRFDPLVRRQLLDNAFAAYVLFKFSPLKYKHFFELSPEQQNITLRNYLSIANLLQNDLEIKDILNASPETFELLVEFWRNVDSYFVPTVLQGDELIKRLESLPYEKSRFLLNNAEAIAELIEDPEVEEDQQRDWVTFFVDLPIEKLAIIEESMGAFLILNERDVDMTQLCALNPNILRASLGNMTNLGFVLQSGIPIQDLGRFSEEFTVQLLQNDLNIISLLNNGFTLDRLTSLQPDTLNKLLEFPQQTLILKTLLGENDEPLTHVSTEVLDTFFANDFVHFIHLNRIGLTLPILLGMENDKLTLVTNHHQEIILRIQNEDLTPQEIREMTTEQLRETLHQSPRKRLKGQQS